MISNFKFRRKTPKTKEAVFYQLKSKNSNQQLLAAAVVLLSISMLNAATTVTWSGKANIEYVGGNLSSIVEVGQELLITFSYNAEAASSFVSSSETFYQDGADIYLKFSLGALVWEAVQSANPKARTAVIQENANGVVDNIIAILQDNWSTAPSNASISGPNVNRMFLVINGSSDLFTGWALPKPQALDLTKVIQFFGYLEYSDMITRFRGQSATLTVVPEPSTSSLFALWFISGILLMVRRRKTI